VRECEGETWEQRLAGDLEHMPDHLSGDVETSLIGFLHVAVARQFHLAATVDRNVSGAVEREQDRVLTAVNGVRTKFDAAKLLRGVEQRYARHRENVRKG
jgi:hypothetical protein